MKTYFRLLSFAKPIEKYAIPYIICTIITVIFGTLNLALLVPLLQVLFKGTGDADLQPVAVAEKPSGLDDLGGWFTYYADKLYYELGPYEALKYVCIVIIASVFLSNVFRYLSQRIMENLRIHTLLNLRKSVFDNVMDLDLAYFTNQRKGDVISKIASDVQVVQFSVTATLQVVFKEPLQLIAYVFVLFSLSAKLTLFSLLVIPVSAFFISRIVKRLKEQAREGQQSYANMISYLDEALSGIKIIKAFNAVPFVKDKFNNESASYSKIMRRMARRQQMSSPVSELLGVVMVAIILLYGGNLVLSGQGDLKASEFIGYIAVFSQVMRPAKALTDAFSNIHSGIAAGERVLDLIDEKSHVNDKPDAVALKSFEQSIVFKDVHFAYGEKEVLKAINIEVPKGKTVALVGPSGGGKSTLVDLIPRFMDVTSGAILFDGTDLRDVQQESLRALIGTVNQESVLFNDTIYNNIAFANESATQEEVEQAARIANAHEFILKTEGGYDTNIGDRGAKLSGGQRQRICIARAVLKNPPIMLLDEATSALDTESEKLVQDSLYKLMENRTTVVIAHRLSTIQNADKIVVIDNGTVVEQGGHLELIAKGGLYKRLIDMQQFVD
ncbi:ABC transporter ATP-binding protein [Sphingobacterium psychroaquaticum]|uniref:ATP-binding cassette, subfamily B, MsbA n=1 Tax=Sphingobacterium psychroaquaticum TaxID=561061 RepID=A0A1X7IQ28_9SPHI|nr:ABC transporter ATP-binding protein [Sphingobacterium psychroaquaticum]QBQ41311.1 ABC transporter ATP-binding protein [Sphingobacterium psychroaquaticum]SMG16823.1 ATP-binding cassette, subfamily B, MsbA [Sphingobacterium psychroaquaticum]